MEACTEPAGFRSDPGIFAWRAHSSGTPAAIVRFHQCQKFHRKARLRTPARIPSAHPNWERLCGPLPDHRDAPKVRRDRNLNVLSSTLIYIWLLQH